MKNKILQIIKSYQDYRLKKFCAKIASRSCQGTSRDLIYETRSLYLFLKNNSLI